MSSRSAATSRSSRKAASLGKSSADGRRAARSNISLVRCSIGHEPLLQRRPGTTSRRDNPEIALNRDGTVDLTKTWFNTDGLRKRPPTNRRRSRSGFPFRVDGVRGPGLFLVNMNVVRNFGIGGGRSLQFRVDVQNLFDAVLWDNPELNPTSTNFGKITGATNSIMRFFTFVWKVNF